MHWEHKWMDFAHPFLLLLFFLQAEDKQMQQFLFRTYYSHYEWQSPHLLHHIPDTVFPTWICVLRFPEEKVAL